jgi:hypothetical protein
MMGWWSVEIEGKEYLQGDGPYDWVGQALDNIAQEYEQDWGRKPTLNELLHTFQVVLGADLERYVSDGETFQLVNLSAKTKRRPKSQRYAVGDFFVIPLENDLFAFGRILSDILKEKMGMLVGIYAFVSRHVHPPTELRNKPFLFPPFYCSDEGWVTWRWRIIGHIPVDPTEFVYPKFKVGWGASGWAIMDRDQIIAATEEDVQGLPNATLSTMRAVERKIAEHLNHS